MVKEKKLSYTSTTTKENTYNATNTNTNSSNSKGSKGSGGGNREDQDLDVHPLAAYLKPMEYVVEEPRGNEFESLEELEPIEEEGEVGEEEGEDGDHRQQDGFTTDQEVDDLEEITSPSLTLNEEDLMMEKVTLVEGDQETATLSDTHNLEVETDEFHRELIDKGLILETEDYLVERDLEEVEENVKRMKDHPMESISRKSIHEDEFEKKLRENHLIMEQQDEEEEGFSDQIDKLSDFEIGSTLVLPPISEISEIREDHPHRETRSHLEEAEFVLSSVRQRMATLRQRHATGIHSSQQVNEEKPIKNIAITSGHDEVSESSWNFMEPKIPISEKYAPEEVTIHILIGSCMRRNYPPKLYEHFISARRNNISVLPMMPSQCVKRSLICWLKFTRYNTKRLESDPCVRIFNVFRVFL
jgi:hypothetical protein